MIVNVKLGIFSLPPLIKALSINTSLELLCYIMKLACLCEFVFSQIFRLEGLFEIAYSNPFILLMDKLMS